MLNPRSALNSTKDFFQASNISEKNKSYQSIKAFLHGKLSNKHKSYSKMKQKIVIVVSMHTEKDRSKAKKLAAGISGVLSVMLKGDDLRQIEVTGDGVDAATITSKLRKKVGYAELVSVGPVDDSNPKPDAKPDPEPVWNPDTCRMPYYHILPVYDNCRDYHHPSCSIM